MPSPPRLRRHASPAARALALLIALGACDSLSPAKAGDPPSAHAEQPAAALAEAPAPPAESPESPAPALVFLGDSLTAGYGLEPAEAIPTLLEARVAAAQLPYRVVNAGRSGDTTAGGLSRLDWYLRDSVNLEALVIGLGSNDAMRGVPVESIRDNLRQIVRRTRKARPQAKIFLWAMKTFPNLGEEYRSAFESLFVELGAQEGVQLLPFPLEGVAGRPDLNQPDGIHPNAAGAEQVAARIWQTLGPALGASARPATP